MIATKDKLFEALCKGTVTVDFYKKDGSLRTMYCTLCADYIDEPWTQISVINPNSDQFRVWDLYNEDWRSFKYSRVAATSVIGQVEPTQWPWPEIKLPAENVPVVNDIVKNIAIDRLEQLGEQVESLYRAINTLRDEFLDM